jgi:hypothetical protein
MPASEAMPASEDMRRLLVSHPANSDSLMVICAEIAYNGGVLYQHATPHKTAERRQLVTVRRSYAAIRSNLMPRYVISYQYKARFAKKESPQHKLAGDIARSGGAL